MADFDQATYPLSDRTRFADHHTVKRDLMDDGTLKVRVVGDSTYRTVLCEFEPMTEQVSADFAAYLVTNRATELDMVFGLASPTETYRGYIWGDPKLTVRDGDIHIWRLDFRGAKV